MVADMPDTNLTLDLRSYSAELKSHRHDYHQLVLPVDGTLKMTIDGQQGEVSADQLAVIAAGRDHDFAAADQNRFVVVDVPADLAPQLQRLPTFIPLDSALMAYVSFLHREKSEGATAASSERQMLLLLIQLLQERSDHSLQIDRRVETARNYLDRHFEENIALAKLAAIANLSERQLTQLFRSQIGMTPRQYLVEKRMQSAWQLLESGTLSVQQIADRVGYTSLAAFSDRFRRHFGVPPSQIRRNGKHSRHSAKDQP